MCADDDMLFYDSGARYIPQRAFRFEQISNNDVIILHIFSNDSSRDSKNNNTNDPPTNLNWLVL